MSNKPNRKAASSLPPPKHPTSRHATAEPAKRSPTAYIIAAVVAAVVAIAVVVIVVAGGGDDKEPPEFYARPVEVSGEAIAPFTEEIQNGADDPAIGEPAPVLTGENYANDPISIDAEADGPTLVVVLAHWCPHCNAEVPVLNQWRDSGDVPEGLNVVGVSTAIDNTRPNYPPDKWLEDKGWEWPVLVDDLDGSVLQAYGVGGYPTMMFIGSDGTVKWRISGEYPITEIQRLVDAAMAAE